MSHISHLKSCKAVPRPTKAKKMNNTVVLLMMMNSIYQDNVVEQALIGQDSTSNPQV